MEVGVKMNYGELREFVDSVYMYFRNKEYANKGQVDLWYKEVKHVPGADDVIQWIFDQFKQRKSMPFNIPLEIKKQWKAYRRAHPEKRIYEQYGPCDDCGGHGLHLFKKADEMYGGTILVNYMAICSVCGNWRKHLGDFSFYGGVCKDTGKAYKRLLKITKREIIENGWHYVEQHQPSEIVKKIDPSVMQQDLDKLVDNVGHKIPF